MNITPPLREYVSSKLTRLQRHFDHLMDAHCILTVEKLRHKAEATLTLRGMRIYADAVEPDMYAAIDGLVDKLDRQVLKHKERWSDYHARNLQKPPHE